jgi:hypothetical protein
LLNRESDEISATHFFAPEAQPKIARSFNCGIAAQNNFKPQRGGRKISDGSAVPAGLDVVFVHNPQLKLRAIFKRRFAADRAAGMDAVDVRELLAK